MFDFDTLDTGKAADKPFEFELTHPVSGEGLSVFLSVIGLEANTFQSFIREEGNRARRRALDAQRKGKGEEAVTVEEEEEALLKALSACVVAWRTEVDGKSDPVIQWGTRKLECTRANVTEWLGTFRWARVQVNAAASDIGNFIRG